MSRAAAGYFGKLPCLGDFVSRRLPRSFVQPWDAWLQRALAASRAQLGADWLEAYLASPFWRFGLSPGLCGPEPWLGVLMPSMDRVGRGFPLTIATPMAPSQSVLGLALQADAWFEAVEALMLAALHPDFEHEDLDERLHALPPIEAPDAPGQRAWHLALSVKERSAAGLGALLDGIAGRAPAPHSSWTTTGSAGVPASLLVCAGLPPESGFTALLGGRWDDPAPSASAN